MTRHAYGADGDHGSGHEAPTAQDDGARREPPVPAVQHRPAVDAELPARSRQAAVHTLPAAERCSPGQRQDGFYVDLGSTFDLGDLRPFQNLHLIPTPAAAGVDATADAQHPHDRDPGPDHGADQGRHDAHRRDGKRPR